MGNTIYKKLGCLAAAAVLALALFLPAESYGASSFKDVRGHWAEKYIETAVAQGIIKGYTDGNFLPDAHVSRAEFVSMLNRALGNTSTGSIRFNDVSSGAWYYTDVSKAVTAGFVSGFDDGTFRPNYKITRQEAAVMLARVIPAYGANANLSKFSDYRSVADWASTALSKVSGKGYISGYTDGKIHPLDSLTRAQAAKIISDIVINETIVTTDPMVKKDGTKLSGRIYSNNVTIHKDLDDGSATIDNCVILGKLIVQGGGEDTVTVNNSRVAGATVDRSADVVRLLAKGETAIVSTTCSRGFILQTSGLSGGNFGPGFEKVSFSSSASGSLQGNFPYVSIDGSSAKLQLLSGTITKLDVNSAGRRSEVTVDSKATISQANVYAESYFHGTGTISDMQVYAKGVTYETKPKKVTVRSGGETPSEEDPELTMTFDPKQGATKVYRDAKITITFNSAMREADKSTITNAEIQDIVTIRKGSSTGSTVAYSGSINSAKTVMTLTPSSLLEENTRYYIVVKAKTMINADGDKNEAETSYFNTGANTETLVVSYSPANGDTGVAVNRTSFTITFTEGIKRYSGTSSLSESYLKDNVITFQKGSSPIDESYYSAAYNSTKKQITITLKSSYELTMNTKYTLGIKSSSLKTSDGTNVPRSSVTWTTAGTPTLSSGSVTPNDLTVDLKVTPNVSGKIYAVLVAGNASRPSAGQIEKEQDAEGKAAIAAANKDVSAGSATTLKLSGGLIKWNTAYKVYAVLYDAKGNASSVVDYAVTIDPLRLKTLKVIVPGGANVLDGFKAAQTDYSVSVPYGTEYVTVQATAPSLVDGGVFIDGERGFTADIDLVEGEATITVNVREEGTGGETYTIRVSTKGSTKVASMTIDGTAYDPNSNKTYPLSQGQQTVVLVIKPEDDRAKIEIKGREKSWGEDIEFTVGENATEEEFFIVSPDGSRQRYTIKFSRD